ncbi:MAG TPA: hypothetical protein VI282_14500 [Verrucomicrobiae bacterium]
MKSLKWFLLLITLALPSGRSEEWRKVAFIGDAEVKTISGVVEIVSGKQERILHEKETARVGQVLRIWRGAEVVLQMKNTKSLVRAKGPVLLRLAPDSESFDRASVRSEEEKTGFIVRAVRGGGKYQDGVYWKPLRVGMCLPDGTRVRPFHDSVLDFYHTGTHKSYRVTDHTRQTALISPPQNGEEASPTIMAAKSP